MSRLRNIKVNNAISLIASGYLKKRFFSSCFSIHMHSDLLSTLKLLLHSSTHGCYGCSAYVLCYGQIQEHFLCLPCRMELSSTVHALGNTSHHTFPVPKNTPSDFPARWPRH